MDFLKEQNKFIISFNCISHFPLGNKKFILTQNSYISNNNYLIYLELFSIFNVSSIIDLLRGNFQI